MHENWNLPYSFNFEGKEVKYGILGDGEPLVLVHGTPWSSFNLRHLIKDLATEYQVFYFDLLGYGESDKSNSDVSLGIQNKLLEALLDHWNIESPYVVGHDFGGTTVLRSHLLDNKAYRKIVLIDPVALSPWGSEFFKHVEQHEDAFSGLPDYIHKAVVETYIKTAAHQQITTETLARTVSPWLGEQGKAAFYRQIAQADSSFTDEFEGKLSEIATPTLLLWGEEDQWIPCQQAHTLHATIPGSSLVTIPQAGHLIIEENPVRLCSEIRRFFNA